MKILFTGRDIQLKVQELAAKIESPDVMLCTLTGAFMFFNDLIRKVPCEIDFVKASSFDLDGHRHPTVVQGPFGKTDLTNKHIVLVEDIVDTGETLFRLIVNLKYFEPAKITVVCLLKRKSFQWEPVNKVELIYGFEVEDKAWLVGYGLDDNGKHRTLPYIFKKS